jgi:SWIM zinc finger
MASTVSHPLPSAQAHAIADLTGYEDQDTLRWQQACVQAANNLTALPNGRYVHIRMEKIRQGLELAQRGAVSLPDDGQALSAVVRSGSNLYQIDMRLLTCTCADYQKHLQACKHLLATEVHIGALGLSGLAEEPLIPPALEPAINSSLPAPAPTAAQWPTSEAPASMNVKLRVGNNFEIMYTARDTNDRDLQERMTQLLPWLAEVMAACEANYEARQRAQEQAKAAPKPPPSARWRSRSPPPSRRP